MGSNDGYDIEKEKRIIVTYKLSGDIKILDGYDDEDGVTKEEDGFLWINTRYSLTGTPGIWAKAEWKRIAPISKIKYTIANKEGYA